MIPDFPAPEVTSRDRAIDGYVSVGDRATVLLKPGLLSWMMAEPRPGAPPPGRGVHPMSGIPLGLAVEAAIEAASGKELGNDVLKACTGEHLIPVYGKETLEAEAHVVSVGRRHVEVEAVVRRFEDGEIAYRARVILVRVVGGRAMEIPRPD